MSQGRSSDEILAAIQRVNFDAMVEKSLQSLIDDRVRNMDPNKVRALIDQTISQKVNEIVTEVCTPQNLEQIIAGAIRSILTQQNGVGNRLDPEAIQKCDIGRFITSILANEVWCKYHQDVEFQVVELQTQTALEHRHDWQKRLQDQAEKMFSQTLKEATSVIRQRYKKTSPYRDLIEYPETDMDPNGLVVPPDHYLNSN